MNNKIENKSTNNIKKYLNKIKLKETEIKFILEPIIKDYCDFKLNLINNNYTQKYYNEFKNNYQKYNIYWPDSYQSFINDDLELVDYSQFDNYYDKEDLLNSYFYLDNLNWYSLDKNYLNNPDNYKEKELKKKYLKEQKNILFKDILLFKKFLRLKNNKSNESVKSNNDKLLKELYKLETESFINGYKIIKPLFIFFMLLKDINNINYKIKINNNSLAIDFSAYSIAINDNYISYCEGENLLELELTEDNIKILRDRILNKVSLKELKEIFNSKFKDIKPIKSSEINNDIILFKEKIREIYVLKEELEKHLKPFISEFNKQNFSKMNYHYSEIKGKLDLTKTLFDGDNIYFRYTVNSEDYYKIMPLIYISNKTAYDKEISLKIKEIKSQMIKESDSHQEFIKLNKLFNE